MTHKLEYRADESLRVLNRVKQERFEKEKRFIDEPQDIAIAASYDDHIDYLMGYLGKISMIAEEIHKFHYLLIPDHHNYFDYLNYDNPIEKYLLFGEKLFFQHPSNLKLLSFALLY